MRFELESAIRDLLFVATSTEQIVERVSARLKENGGTRPERRAFLNLLIQSGHHKKAYELIGHWMPDRERIPWKELLFLLKNAGYKPKKEFLDYFFLAMDQVDPKDNVQIFEAWTHVDERFKNLNERFLNELKTSSETREQRLFEKLEYFRAHRMINEEEKLLNDLAMRFPEKPEIEREKEKFRSRWAHHLIAEKARERSHQERMEKVDVLTQDEWEFGDHMLNVMEDHIKREPQMAYDFSVGLFMMEFYHQAMQMIRVAQPNLATDWFRLEILIKARRYLECLEDLTEVEMKYADDPESAFASTYLRARVLKGLGQVGPAMELLKSIVSIRPHYRSAHALILQWGQGI